MKPTIIAILSCLLLSSCATGPAKWTKAEKIKEFGYAFLHAIEVEQTIYGIEELGAKELNPMLGEHPSEGRTRTIGFITGFGHFLTTHYIWKEKRAFWQNSTLVFKVGGVANNYYVGAKVKF